MLYSLNKNSSFNTWDCFTEEDGNVVVVFGKEGGKMQREVYTVEPKNVGKANETTLDQQAALEVKSKIAKQIKKGYRKDKSELGGSVLAPLVHKWGEKAHMLKYPVLGFPKLDGVRCTMFYENGEVRFQQRGGDSYPTIKAIADELIDTVFRGNPDAIVDGELYNHGMYLEDITAGAKGNVKYSDKLEFHVFDYVEDIDDDFDIRYSRYISKLNRLDKVKTVRSRVIYNEYEAEALHYDCVANGYEGVVFRNYEGKYEAGQRSTDVIKMKVALTEEFLCVDMAIGKKGGIPICEYTKPDGTKGTFKANMAVSTETKRYMGDNPEEFVGRWLTVDFEKLSKYMTPSKPVGKAFRRMSPEGEPLE